MPPPHRSPSPTSAARGWVGYLGPEGTFSEEAVLASVEPGTVRPVPIATIYDAVMAVQEGRVQWALVPIENSIEGSVTVTLDTLAGEAADVVVVGELVIAVRQCLIASSPVALEEIEAVVSHPQAAGQCARFLRSALPGVDVRSASSTADAVRIVSEASEPRWAALGTRLAAEIYGCVVLRDGVEDHHDNETRFVWLARAGRGEPLPPPVRPPARANAIPRWKTSLLFWGPGADAPGWLVDCLGEFSRRRVNLTKIESRPRRERLGRYMFFADLEGAAAEASVAAAIGGLRGHCEQVRVLGSYPAAA
jgi:prephenate dehydratase